MLETIQKGFRTAKNRLKGYREISESNIEDALRDIRVSLLEADVEFHVVKNFLTRVKQKAVGELVLTRIEKDGERVEATPGDHFIKICHDELVDLMGPVDTEINMATTGLTKIMMVGLQGSGKTTTTGKLASHIQRKYNKKCCLVAADIYRPAAVDQLKVLGQRLGVPVYYRAGASPPELCSEALPFARQNNCDVVLFDTAGRLAIDDALMRELESIQARTRPENVFLVCDAMIGQDAVKTASEFDRRLDLTGVVLTKLDGDARGGAALSIKDVTGKPIKFLGMGESLDKLEEFRPEGLASRILGFGDIVGLMKDFEEIVDEKKAEEDAKRLLSGNFNMTHFLEQIRTIKKMGSLKDLFERMPFFGDGLPEGINLDDKELVRVEAIIGSMTRQERLRPELIDESRAVRIAKGCGRKKHDVLGLLERFKGMRAMMGHIGRTPGLLGKLPGFKQLSQLKQIQGLDFSEFTGQQNRGTEMVDEDGNPIMPGVGPGGISARAIHRQATMMKRAGMPIPPEMQELLDSSGTGKGKQGAKPLLIVSDDKKKERRKKEKAARNARKKNSKKK